MSNPFRDRPDLPPVPATSADQPQASARQQTLPDDFFPKEQQGTPLSALFLALSAAAVIFALIAPRFADEDHEQLPLLLLGMVGGGIALGFWSGIITLILTFSRQTTIVMALAGFILGATVPQVFLVPTKDFGRAAITSLVGCGLMLVVAIVGRRKRQKQAEVPPR